jgi:hypothetical protein
MAIRVEEAVAVVRGVGGKGLEMAVRVHGLPVKEEEGAI